MVDTPRSRLQQLRLVELLLAVGVLLTTWIEVESVVASYPTWLYLGDITIPTFVILPTVLASTLIGHIVIVHSRQEELTVTQLGSGGLAVVTLLTVVYAIVNLTIAQPGVFFAGFLPLIAGVLLAVSVLLSQGRTLARRMTHRVNND